MKKTLFVLSLVAAIPAYAKQPTLLDELSYVLQARAAQAPASGLIETLSLPMQAARNLS
jgi:hypothetical protein